MKHQYIDGILYFYFYGDLGNLTVCNLKQIYIDPVEKYQPKMVELDFEEVTSVDSTGIGSVLAYYKQPQKLHAQFILYNLSRVNRTLFKTSEIFQVIRHERNEVRL